jgi:hypothetical protein
MSRRSSRGSGNDTMSWSLAFAPLLPLWLIASLGGFAMAMVVVVLLRGIRGAWLRAAAVAALIAALLNPFLLREDREPLPTVVALVSDESASQSLDGRDLTTAATRAALVEKLADFSGIELRDINAGGATKGVATDGTRLFDALGASLTDVPPDRVGGMIMLSDGQVHDAPLDNSALAPGAPLHALISGNDNEIDRRIVIDNAPRFGIVGEAQIIRYRVLDDGIAARAGQRINVTVSRDGTPYAIQSVIPGADHALIVDIAHGGQNIIEFEAEPLAGELTEINNRAVASIEGVRENLRVLLVSGEPHAGERTWRNLLKSDAAVDLVHFTILRPPEKQDGTPIDQLSLIAFPTRELFSEKIDEFDLIILDRYQHRGVLPILYFDNISRYIRDGGALLVAAGPDYAGLGSIYDTPLSSVLPGAPTGKIVEEPYHAKVTELGERHPVTRDLEGGASEPPEWGRWLRLVDVEGPNGNVVMSGAEDKPLLILNRDGDGRVALLLSDHAWLWARGFEGGGPHVDLLRRLSHWLMQEPDLDEEALRATAQAGELIVERQTMDDATEPVIIRSPSGQVDTVTLDATGPGLWRSSSEASDLGLYRIEQGEARAFTYVGTPNPREFIDARSSEEKLRPIIEATGGLITRMSDSSGEISLPRIVPIRSGGAMSGDDWIGIRRTEASVLRGVERMPLLAGLLGLAILLGTLAATWYREGW